ncbi:MAG TPA: FAD-dependent oxidoreductase [Mycobacteriales bacterium]|nr:FAD-dependent oxidoreductase [Mycobacteriales bacterium]
MQFDAIVVGAGVIGSSVAFELAKSGRSVLCVDAGNGPGQGSTSASSANIRFHYSTLPGVAASWEAKFCWERWADHLGLQDSAGLARFIRSGTLVLNNPLVRHERILKLYDEVGIPYEVWDPETLAQKVPGIDTGFFSPPRRLDDPAFWEPAAEQVGGFFCPDGGFVDDPLLAAVNLADAAKRHGTVFRFKTRVTGVVRDDSHVLGVVLDDDVRASAPIVVNVAGPWSSQLNELAMVLGDFTVSTRPMRQEVHHLPAPEGYNSPHLPGPAINDVGLGTYARGTPGDGYLVGGTEPECDELQWLDRPEDANPNPTRELWEAQTTRAAKRFPTLTVPHAISGIVGVYDVTEDWTPIYDKTSLHGYYVAIGTSGNQFKNAPVAGRFIRAIVEAETSGRDHDVDPVQYVGEHTGVSIDLAAFSRKRPRNTASSNTVMG